MKLTKKIEDIKRFINGDFPYVYTMSMFRNKEDLNRAKGNDRNLINSYIDDITVYLNEGV